MMECDEDGGRQITAELVDLTGIRLVSKERILGGALLSVILDVEASLQCGPKGQDSLIASRLLWRL